MQVLCPVCGVVARAKDVQSGPQGLSWTCGACGRRVSESIGEKESDGDRRPKELDIETPNDEVDRCPKCGEAKTGRPDCPRCGLVFELWDPSSGLELIPALEAAWETLLDSYENESAHARFLEKAVELGRLDLAAAYYRARAAEFRDDAMAARQLERIATMVQFEALAPRQRRQLVSPTFVWIMRILLGLLILVGFYYVFTFSAPPPKPVQTVRSRRPMAPVTGSKVGPADHGRPMGAPGAEVRQGSEKKRSSDSGSATPISTPGR